MHKRIPEEIVWTYTLPSNSWFGLLNGKHVAEIHYEPIYETYGLYNFDGTDDIYGSLLEAQTAAAKANGILSV